MEYIKEFTQETGEIYRLKVPFETLYTSVFLIKTEQGNALIDCATDANDVDEWIVPALLKNGISLFDIRFLILTHNHGDHAGGKERILQLNSKIKIVVDSAEKLFNDIDMYELKGHTLDCFGIIDNRSGTLISGDAIQGYGVGKYRCFLESREEYLKTIEKIRQEKKIKNILFSHAYEPWYKDGVFGREVVEKILKDCVEAL